MCQESFESCHSGFLSIFSLLSLSVFDLGSGTGQTDRQTDDGHQHTMPHRSGDTTITECNTHVQNDAHLSSSVVVFKRALRPALRLRRLSKRVRLRRPLSTLTHSQGRSDGVYRYIYTPKSVYLKTFYVDVLLL